MKVIEKIAANNQVLFSFEFSPPKKNDDVFFQTVTHLATHNPVFCDVTWGAAGSGADRTIDIAGKMQNVVGVETMMHITCTNMPVEEINRALDAVKSSGIQNILALRGDPPSGQGTFVPVEGGFSCARDLVRHIRGKYKDYFCISVSGYPEAHPGVFGPDGMASPEAYHNDLLYLKSKVDAGADLILTQLFYDTDILLNFVKDCREIGINCPIVPGIMPIKTYNGFRNMTRLCKTKIPDEISAALEAIKDNEEAVRNYGVDLATQMCNKMIANGINTLHLFTLNSDVSALAILKNLGMIEESKIWRPLPESIDDQSYATNGEIISDDI